MSINKSDNELHHSFVMSLEEDDVTQIYNDAQFRKLEIQ